MRKFWLVLAAILSSVWFAPVTLVAGIGLGMETICLQQQCRRTYGPQDVAAFNCTAADPQECKDFYSKRRENPETRNTPPYGLMVAVALPSEGHKVTVIPLNQWPDMKIKKPSASLMLPVTQGGDEGSSSSPVSTFSVLSSAPTSQIISTHFFDDLASDFKYETDGTTIKPISSKVTNAGYTFATFPFALFLAWAVRRIALWGRRRLYRAVPA
jgi:hypothetical protein